MKKYKIIITTNLLINHAETKRVFGYAPEELISTSGNKILANCFSCGELFELRRSKTRRSSGKCNKCRITKPSSLSPYVLIEETKKQLGFDLFSYPKGIPISKWVIAACPRCGTHIKKRYRYVHCLCRSCATIIHKHTPVPHDIPKWILVDETIKKYGYAPADLKLRAQKKVVVQCQECFKHRDLPKFQAMISQRCRLCCNKNEEARKMRIGQIPSTHAFGEFYFCRFKNKNVWLRSSWEVVYAKYLDNNGVMWDYEITHFPIEYIDMNGVQTNGSYTPDFFIVNENVYHEVKGYWRKDARAKYEATLLKFPETKIEIIDKAKFKELKIKLPA